MLGCFGVGAVIGALLLSRIKERMSDERAIQMACLLLALGAIGAGLSRNAVITGGLLTCAGAGWMISTAVFNISIQLSSPRWVTARALAACYTGVCSGMTLGGWAWGHIATDYGTDVSLIISGVVMISTMAAGIWWRMPTIGAAAPSRRAAVRARDQPRPERAQRADRGNGGISDPHRECPRLLHRNDGDGIDPASHRRLCLVDLARCRRSRAVDRALSYPRPGTIICASGKADAGRYRDLGTRARLSCLGADDIRVRRMLERPYGSGALARRRSRTGGIIVPLPGQGSVILRRS